MPTTFARTLTGSSIRAAPTLLAAKHAIRIAGCSKSCSSPQAAAAAAAAAAAECTACCKAGV